jgi:signal transduction histidine kinase/DNA-binding response OmpR family regulator
MTPILISIILRQEHDVVAARQRSRLVAELLGFDRIDQTRIATAVSEIARNAVQYAGGGRVEFRLEGDTAPQLLVIVVTDQGRGIADLQAILAGRYRSETGMGIGVAAARRLMDRCDIDTTPRGTAVTLAKLLPARAPVVAGADLGRLSAHLAERRPESAIEEVQQQNQELIRTLEVLRARQDEVERINRELEDTNRGVVALYAELDERADHLRRADELKTKFLSNMTHEFRTPVNSILALSRLLGERLGAGEEKDEVFYIRKSAQQLSELIDDLLDIAKVEAGKIDVRPGLFEIRNLFGALRGMLRPLLVGHAVALIFEEPDDLLPLYSDETKVSQILRNFVSNALKYTEQGEVRVTASLDRDRSEMSFTVTDTGIGIPEAELPRIFDEFVQIENPLQRRVKGTGLGLPLSRRLAQLLDGRIDVRSRLGEGSAFTLTLPLLHRDAARVAVPTISPDCTPVLLVEDSDEDALLYQRLLAGTRFELVHARSLDAARQLLQIITPAAVLLDIRLHGQDAWELLIRIRQDSATAAMPVIVISSADHRRKAFGLGATAFALKPVPRDWLLGHLEAGEAAGRVRVLTIDDEETFRYIIRETLGTAEYELAEAPSAQEGLAMVPEFRPDVVLLDLNLPGLDGYDVAARLAERQAAARVPVIIVTSQRVTPETRIRLGEQIPILPKSALSRELLRAAIREAIQVAPTA